jgi:flagellar hook-associated protein 2
MVMRIGGLASGMDIDELVEKLMTAERTPLNKLEQQKQTYEWQRDAYRGVNTKLKTLDTYISDNLILKKINTKTASSSNSNLVTATASSSASGSVSIEGVSQLASSARAVGQQINATETTKLSTLIGGGTQSISLKGINADGSMPAEATKIEITEGMTVSQFVSKINASNVGVTAVFENGRFSFTAKNSGDNKVGDEIEVTDGQDVLSNLGFYKDASGAPTSTFQTTEGKNAVFKVNGIATERASNTFTLNGYNISLKSTFNEGTTHNANSSATAQTLANATTNINNLLTTLSGSYNVDLTTYSTIADKVEAVKNEISAKVTEHQTALDAANATLTASLNQFYEDDEVKALGDDAKAFLHSLTKEQRDELAKKNLDELDVDQQDWTQDQKDQFTANKDALKDLSAASITNTVGKVYNNLSAEAKAYIADNTDFSNVSTSELNDEEKAIITSFGNEFKTIANQTADVDAAKATLNSAKSEANELVQTTNAYNKAVNANNTIGTAPVTTVSSAPIELTSTSNIDETVNKIKDFVNTYNTFIKELSDQTKESKYRDYQPLTAEQKKEMDEDEIKLWEEKAKSGLLRNDSIVRNGLSNMRSLIYQSNPSIEDTRFNTLFNIGITTSKNYNDGGTLEIDETKLRKALEENPDAVEQLLKNTSGKKDDVIDGETVDTRGFLEKLRASMKSLETNIEKRAGRSTMTNAQFTIGKNLISAETRIKTWQDKLENIESRYWKQFTAMETAINKANSQSSLFMG